MTNDQKLLPFYSHSYRPFHFSNVHWRLRNPSFTMFLPLTSIPSGMHKQEFHWFPKDRIFPSILFEMSYDVIIEFKGLYVLLRYSVIQLRFLDIANKILSILIFYSYYNHSFSLPNIQLFVMSLMYTHNVSGFPLISNNVINAQHFSVSLIFPSSILKLITANISFVFNKFASTFLPTPA